MIHAVIRNHGWRLALALGFLGVSSVASWAQSPQTNGPVLLQGAGSTFGAPLYRKWIEEYEVAHRKVSISYDAVGSGEGVKRFIANTVDFAGSDEILTETKPRSFVKLRLWHR